MTRYKYVGPPRRSSRLAALRSSVASSENRDNAVDTSPAVSGVTSDAEAGMTGFTSSVVDVTSQHGDADASMDVPAPFSDNQAVVTASPLSTGTPQEGNGGATVDASGTSSGQTMVTELNPAPATNIVALSTFTCFPNLPAELRHEIWTLVSFFPRNVDIRARQFGQIYCKDGDLSLPYDLMEYFSKTPPPTILQTNAESRMIGVRNYKRLFSFDNGDERDFGWIFRTEPRIYVNFESDWICPLGMFEFDGQWDFISHRGINNLALNASVWHDQELLELIDKDYLKGNLIKNIILHNSSNACTHHGPIEFVELGPDSAKDDEGERAWFNNKHDELLREIDAAEEVVKNIIRVAEEEEKVCTAIGRAENISDWKRWQKPAMHLKRMLIGGVDCSIKDVKRTVTVRQIC